MKVDSSDAGDICYSIEDAGCGCEPEENAERWIDGDHSWTETDTQTQGNSYRVAMFATAVTGASSLVVVALGIARSKVIAITVGPDGIGLFGLLSSTIALVATAVGLGLNSSGVRQVAAAVAASNPVKIARVIYLLRRSSLVLGLFGATLTAIFAKPIAEFSMGTSEYSHYLWILAPMVLFMTVNGGQTALLRGLRKIGQLARLNIFGALVGTAAAIPLVLMWGLDGIAPAMLITSASSVLASWWYARQVEIRTVNMTRIEARAELSGLFGLGVAFFMTGLMISALQFGLRSILMHQTDLYTVGQFVAAVALSHVYVNFVLQAMGLDYLPRLTRVHRDRAVCNRLVNEQTEIAILVAGPGVVALVVLAPLLIPLLYSGRFTDAIEVFRWQCLGVLLQVASWPIGTVILAHGARRMFVATQAALNLVYLAAFAAMTSVFGLLGAAMSFAVAQAFYLAMVFPLVTRMTGLRWGAGTRNVLLVSFTAFAISLASLEWLGTQWGVAVGLLFAVATAVWAFRQLEQRLDLSLFQLLRDRLVPQSHRDR